MAAGLTHHIGEIEERYEAVMGQSWCGGSRPSWAAFLRAGSYDAGMIRRIFTIISALSLLLSIAAGSIWIRCHFYWDEVEFGIPEKDRVAYALQSIYREIRITRIDDHRGLSAARHWHWHALKAPADWRPKGTIAPVDWGWTHLGISVRYRRFTGGPGGGGLRGSMWSVIVPPPVACVLFLIAPFLWLASRYLRRRPQGICRQCGYDLRASKDRCPECGTPISARHESLSFSDYDTIHRWRFIIDGRVRWP